MSDIITMAHGSGGSATKKLIEDIFVPNFSNPHLNGLEDSAVVDVTKKIAVTTDSFVVSPPLFRGGDIGRLAVCGTVNDLLMRGAVPKYLTCGLIMEEGLEISVLEKIVRSLALTAKEANVNIVTGDTKVIEGNGGIYINTAGIGVFEQDNDISAANAQNGDVLIVTGNLGDHHASILSERMGIENDIQSDCAPLCEAAKVLRKFSVRSMRDVTRGGLATVLKELAESSNLTFYVDEDKIPISESVKNFSALLGLDPMYMGNEGKIAAVIPREYAEEAVSLLKKTKYAENTVIIGEVKDDERNSKLIMRTKLGGLRELDILHGEGLPRIC